MLAGTLVAGPHICQLNTWTTIYLMAVGWTASSGPTYMSAGTLGVVHISYGCWLDPLVPFPVRLKFIPNKSPAIQELYLVVLGMQLFKPQ